MRNALVAVVAFGALAAAVVGLAGCSKVDVIHNGRVAVVASTDVYGSVVSLIGGDRVDVTSLVGGAGANPREYEVTAQDRTAVMNANLVVYNGGGFDPFMYPLLTFTGVHEVDAAVASGRLPASSHAGDGGTDTVPDGFDPHVFYDLTGMEQVAKAIGDELTSLDPGGATTYAANEAAFTSAVDVLIGREQAIAAKDSCGDTLASPVAGYLLRAVGCNDAASASGLGGAASTSPTGSPAAVSFAETLSGGEDYLAWMTANLDAVEAALD